MCVKHGWMFHWKLLKKSRIMIVYYKCTVILHGVHVLSVQLKHICLSLSDSTSLCYNVTCCKRVPFAILFATLCIWSCNMNNLSSGDLWPAAPCILQLLLVCLSLAWHHSFHFGNTRERHLCNIEKYKRLSLCLHLALQCRLCILLFLSPPISFRRASTPSYFPFSLATS